MFYSTGSWASFIKNCTLDKHKLTGQNLARVFNFRRGRACLCHATAFIQKQLSLKVKTRPPQPLGYLPLAFFLPDCMRGHACMAQW
jgi:hypothetical protein